MLSSCPGVTSTARRAGAVLLVLALFVACCPTVQAQFFTNSRAVGGIDISPEGILADAAVDNLDKLSQLRRQHLQEVPADIKQMAEFRKVSLRRLEATIQRCVTNNEELPDEIKYLAGLQQIRYVFVDPERRDIVLVGPGEGWQVDPRGNLVGITTARPVMLLDDLLVALRTARQAADGGISCSIDPTEAGLQQLRRHVRTLRTIGNPRQTAAQIEQVLGPQQISIHGVPDTSHFARVLLAADYRMKRLAMSFDKPPIEGLPSFLSMMGATRRGMSNMLPRWWLEPDYEPLLHSPDRLAWELRGASVKAMTEQDYLASGGNLQHTGAADPLAQKWADNMTEKYEELATAEPIFGQLRNCMESAIVAALIVKEDLTGKAGYSMPLLLDPADVEIEQFTAPKNVPSQASVLKKGRNWVISASGGVQVNSWSVADNVKQTDDSLPARAKAVPRENTNWWWN